MPIFFMPGQLGLFLLAIPVVTTCVFIVSLIEALWILPAHLAHGKRPGRARQAQPKKAQMLFEAFRERCFVPCVAACLENRGMVITLGLFIAGAIVSWVASGRMPIALQPSFEGQQVTTMFSLDPGASDRQVDEMAEEIETLGLQVLEELGDEGDMEGVSMEMGAPASHQGAVSFTLVQPGERPFSSGEFAERWRDLIGQPARLTQLAIDYTQGPGDGRDLTIELAHAPLPHQA